MKKITDWALILSCTFLLIALLAFFDSNFIDATFLAMFGFSGLFFLMSPQRSKDYRWNSFKLISYIFLICGVAVCVFKYYFLQDDPTL